MPKPISRRDITARADQVLNQRRDAVAALADAQSAVDDLTTTFNRELDDLRAAQTARLKDAAAKNARAWSSAVSAGWSEEDLRRFGFTEPEIKARARRTRSSASAGTSTSPTTSQPGSTSDTAEAATAAGGSAAGQSSTPTSVTLTGTPSRTP